MRPCKSKDPFEIWCWKTSIMFDFLKPSTVCSVLTVFPLTCIHGIIIRVINLVKIAWYEPRQSWKGRWRYWFRHQRFNFCNFVEVPQQKKTPWKKRAKVIISRSIIITVHVHILPSPRFSTRRSVCTPEMSNYYFYTNQSRQSLL